MTRASLLALALAAATPLGAQEPTAPRADLRTELERLGREDQAGREGIAAAAAANDTLFLKRMMAGDSARTARLREIVAAHGWPGRALVGEEGARAAWLILQHGDDTAFQEAMLPRLWDAAAAGDVSRADVAMLTDRVLVRRGEPQRYGSSFSMLDGRLVADPIGDLSGLEARRAEVGLPPMAEYVAMMRKMYGVPVIWPEDSRP